MLELRSQLLDVIEGFKEHLKREDFNAIPFMNVDGYHNKTIAYSLWHIIRIEDIVTHSFINHDEQIFFLNHYQKRIGSPIITTGNELVKEGIAEFSRLLDIDELYEYISKVNKSTTQMINRLSFKDLKRKMADQERTVLDEMKVVSTDEQAYWLIDYWCGKDIRGLIGMPLSRHWIMHIEACLRIENKL